jgi:hypothetical protein
VEPRFLDALSHIFDFFVDSQVEGRSHEGVQGWKTIAHDYAVSHSLLWYKGGEFFECLNPPELRMNHNIADGKTMCGISPVD